MEVRIKLVGFQCHRDLDLTLPLSKLILFYGDNGTGKSTVFRAFVWCLYDKGRNLQPLTNPGKIFRVELYLPGITIIRQKNPCILTVATQAGVFKDDQGQDIIGQMFGSYHVWLTSCYIGQKKHHLLMSAPDSLKTELLSQLAFRRDDPDEIIDKIETVLTQVRTKWETENRQFDIKTATIKSLKDSLDMTRALSSEQKAVLIDEQAALNRVLPLYTERQKKHYQTIGARTNVASTLEQNIKQLSAIDQTLSSYPIIPEPEVEVVSEAVVAFKSRERDLDQLITFRKQLDGALAVFSKAVEPPPLDPNCDLASIITQERLRESNQALLAPYRLPYQRELIDSEIVRIGGLLDLQPELIKKNKATILTDKIATFPDLSIIQSQMTDLQVQISNLNNVISTNELATDVLTCPRCQGHVRYKGKALVVSETAPYDVQALAKDKIQLESLRGQVRTLKIAADSIVDLQRQLSFLGPVRDDVVGTPLDEASIKASRNYVDQLRKVQIYPEPSISSKDLRLRIEDIEKYRKIKESYTSLLTHPLYRSDLPLLEQFVVEKSQIQLQLTNHDTYIKEYQKRRQYRQDLLTQQTVLNQQRTWFQTQISTLQIQLEGLILDPEADLLVRETTTRKVQVEEILAYQGKIEKVLSQEQDLTQDKIGFEVLHQRVLRLSRLKSAAIETISHTLANVVNNLNITLNQIIPRFFDNGLTARIKLFKELSDKGRTKPNINIQIYHHGAEMTPDQLCGGEEDLVSLALSLAFAQGNKFPLLILDESMSSLSSRLRDNIVDILREITPTKTIITVAHDLVTGQFDKIIPF